MSNHKQASRNFPLKVGDIITELLSDPDIELVEINPPKKSDEWQITGHFLLCDMELVGRIEKYHTGNERICWQEDRVIIKVDSGIIYIGGAMDIPRIEDVNFMANRFFWCFIIQIFLLTLV